MRYAILILSLYLIGCGKPTPVSKTEDKGSAINKLSDQTGMAVNIIKMLESETKCKAEHLKRNESGVVDFGDTTYVFKERPKDKSVILPGIWSSVKSKEDAYNVVNRIQPKLKAQEYRTFVCNGRNLNDGDKVAVVQSDNEFTPLVYMQTNGINQGLDNSQLISRRRILNEHLGLKILGADFDWCEFEITNEPGNWNSLASELFKFCPDIVEQGTGNVEHLAKEMEKSKKLHLWFD